MAPLRDFLAMRLREILDFGIAVKQRACEPSITNVHTDPDFKPLASFPEDGATYHVTGHGL